MKRVVLIAEDSKTDCIILRNIIQDTYEVKEANDGREALDLFDKFSAELSAIIVDIHMPDVDGLTFIKSITSSPKWRQIPIIVASGDRDIKQEEASIKLGAIGFIQKPYNKTILLHTVRNSIALHEAAALSNSVKRDNLTGLLNRVGFIEEASPIIENAPKGTFVVTVFNIENFKLINDQFGTKAGDKLLQLCANTINESLQEPGEEGMVGRLNSDRFIIISSASNLDNGTRQKYYERIWNPPFLPQKVRFRIGRCFVDDTSIPLSSYIDRAFMAEQSIKKGYGPFIASYDESMMAELFKRQEIASKMVDAVHNKEFVPYYQPQYNHESGALIGAEALVRWIENGRVVRPDTFIPLFEQNGFIYEMDKYVWEAVCQDLRRWIDAGINPPPVSVNISRFDLLHEHCQSFLLSLIAKYSLPMYLLRLEITESAFSSESPVFKKIEKLIGAGFTVEIDDFGSGYSSLNALKDVKASIMKLDMRFFETCADESRAGTIVQFSVRLAKWLGMDVIAEGVETKPQADFLKSIGCFFIQGFLYSKPLPLAEYEKLLAKGPAMKPSRSSSSVKYRVANISDPSSFDTWVYKTKAGPACLLEIRNGAVEVLRVNDAYVAALNKIEISVNDVLRVNWMAYFDEETKKAFPPLEKRIMKGEMDVPGKLRFLNLPHCPRKLIINSKQTLLANGPDSMILYCAVEFYVEEK